MGLFPWEPVWPGCGVPSAADSEPVSVGLSVTSGRARGPCGVSPTGPGPSLWDAEPAQGPGVQLQLRPAWTPGLRPVHDAGPRPLPRGHPLGGQGVVALSLLITVFSCFMCPMCHFYIPTFCYNFLTTFRTNTTQFSFCFSFYIIYICIFHYFIITPKF